MTKLEHLEQVAYEDDINIIDIPIDDRTIRAFSVKNENSKIVVLDKSAIKNDKEALELVSEEIGHFKSNTFYHIQEDFNNPANRSNILRAEHLALKWAVYEVVPYEEIQKALDMGYTEYYDIAEYCDVTINFIKKAFILYQQKGVRFRGLS